MRLLRTQKARRTARAARTRRRRKAPPLLLAHWMSVQVLEHVHSLYTLLIILTVDEALASALTKFDSPDTYFGGGKKAQAGMDEIKRLLMTEMSQDMGVTEADDAATKQLRGAVQKCIGTSYGKWKAGQAN
jgi:20S proteasome alpha/beta subunit